MAIRPNDQRPFLAGVLVLDEADCVRLGVVHVSVVDPVFPSRGLNLHLSRVP